MDLISKGWEKQYFDAPNEIFDAPISGYAKMVYLYLCRCADAEKKAFPGYADIAKKTGFSRATVRRAIAELGERKLLVKIHHYNPETKRFKSNEYRLIHPSVMLSQSTPMLSQSTPMLSQSTPMLSQSTPMLSQSTYKYPGKKPMKNTQEKNIIIKEDSGADEAIGQAPAFDDDDVLELERFASSKGVKASRVTIQRWMRMADDATVRAAIEEAAGRPDVRRKAGYVTTLLKSGYSPEVAATSESTAPEDTPDPEPRKNSNPKYAEFYRLIEQSKSRGGLVEFDSPAGMEK